MASWAESTSRSWAFLSEKAATDWEPTAGREGRGLPGTRAPGFGGEGGETWENNCQTALVAALTFSTTSQGRNVAHNSFAEKSTRPNEWECSRQA